MKIEDTQRIIDAETRNPPTKKSVASSHLWKKIK